MVPQIWTDRSTHGCKHAPTYACFKWHFLMAYLICGLKMFNGIGICKEKNSAVYKNSIKIRENGKKDVFVKR